MQGVRDPERSGMPLPTMEICQARLSIIQQRWWVEIASAGMRYGEARSFHDNALVGILPYVTHQSRRLRIINKWGGSPPWSHLGGPVVSEAMTDGSKAKVVRDLIEQLPKHTSFTFTCDHSRADAALIKKAFTAAGFKHEVQKTYLLLPEQNVFDGLGRRLRNHLRRRGRRWKLSSSMQISLSASIKAIWTRRACNAIPLSVWPAT